MLSPTFFSSPTCDGGERRWQEAEAARWRSGTTEGTGGVHLCVCVQVGVGIDADKRRGSDSFRRKAAEEGWRD